MTKRLKILFVVKKELLHLRLYINTQTLLLGCIKRIVASGAMEVIVPLYCAITSEFIVYRDFLPKFTYKHSSTACLVLKEWDKKYQ